jgi:hypothetical protein
VIGSDTERIPRKVEDFVRVLADRLGLPGAALSTLPVRPDRDKPQKWASEDVPKWFAEQLEKHEDEVADQRGAAREVVAEVRRLQDAMPIASVARIAENAAPVRTQTRPIAWIVLDQMDRSTVERILPNLLAGLIGVGLEEASIPPALRRLRWLFLGYSPDFLTEGDVTLEKLNAAPTGLNAIGKDAAVKCIKAAFSAQADAPLEETLDGVRATLDALDDTELWETIGHQKRLAILQQTVEGLIEEKLPEVIQYVR